MNRRFSVLAILISVLLAACSHPSAPAPKPTPEPTAEVGVWFKCMRGETYTIEIPGSSAPNFKNLTCSDNSYEPFLSVVVPRDTVAIVIKASNTTRILTNTGDIRCNLGQETENRNIGEGSERNASYVVRSDTRYPTDKSYFCGDVKAPFPNERTETSVRLTCNKSGTLRLEYWDGNTFLSARQTECEDKPADRGNPRVIEANEKLPVSATKILIKGTGRNEIDLTPSVVTCHLPQEGSGQNRITVLEEHTANRFENWQRNTVSYECGRVPIYYKA